MAAQKPSEYKRTKKLHGAKSPGSIVNEQHHDKSNSERDIAGSPGTPDRIISDSATAQVVDHNSIIRVMNTTAGVVFLAIGKQADIPAGAPTIADGIAIAPNFYENFYLGEFKEAKESVFIKSSDNGLQVVVFED